jgi:cell division septum initiation protein DivIVA
MEIANESGGYEMVEDKVFGTTMFGFDKDDVNTYIDRMIKEFETKLRQRDEEINLLKLQNRDLKDRFEEMSKKNQNSDHDKNKILDVLLKAQENAEKMIEEAREKSKLEKVRLEDELQKETQLMIAQIKKDKERVVFIKDQLIKLKKQALLTVQSFEKDLDVVIQTEDMEINDILTPEKYSKNKLSNNKEFMGNKKKGLENMIHENTDQYADHADMDSNKLIQRIDELNNSISGVTWNYQKKNKKN